MKWQNRENLTSTIAHTHTFQDLKEVQRFNAIKTCLQNAFCQFRLPIENFTQSNQRLRAPKMSDWFVYGSIFM